MQIPFPRFPQSPRGAFARPIPLKSYLTRLMIGVVGPLLLFAVIMMVLFARHEKGSRQRGLESAARSLALAIEQEIKASITKLEAFSTLEALDTGSVGVFQEAAERFVQTQKHWRDLTVFDPRGAALATVPGGNHSARIGQEALAELLKTRQPTVTAFSPGEAGDVVRVHVPVVRDQTIIYVLSASIDPWAFTEILAQQKIAADWIGTLYNAQGITIARSREAKQWIGKPVNPFLRRTGAVQGEQFLHGQTTDGGSAYAAVSRSPLTGWFLALTVPRAEIDAWLYGSIVLLGGGGVFLLLIGLGVGLLFARRASHSMVALSAAARALGRGNPVPFPGSTPIAELDILAAEMTRASHLLRERERERDRVEAELRQQEESLQRQADLLNLANEAIFATRLDGRIMYWNRGAEELYGYSEREALGALGHEFLATEFPEGWSRFEAALMAAGEWSGELKQINKRGVRLDVESRFKMIQDRSGNRLILECSRDITHRKKAARRRAVEHQVTLALAESDTPDAAWGKLLEALGAGLEWHAASFWLVDPSNRMLECARSWRDPDQELAPCDDRAPLARGAGLPGKAWEREVPVWITGLQEEGDDLQRFYPEWTQVRAAFAFPIRMRSAVLGVVELLGMRARQIDLDMLRSVQAIGGEVGQFIERLRAEAALRESEEHLRTQAQELEQQLLASGRLVAVGELTASMAHEFNNPLGIILGFAQGLLESMGPGHPDYRQVQIIADEAKRCERLVQELLEFGRPKNAEFIPTDIEEVIHRTLQLVQPHAAKSGVKVVAEFAAELPRLLADPQQLQQLLLNLSLNAVDAMPKGGRLTLKASRHGAREILVAVEDTGIGMDGDLLRKIFQPFITSKKRRGLGLGLPICDRIVKAHGGSIRVRSRVGEGTTFEAVLPLEPPGAGAPANAISPAPRL